MSSIMDELRRLQGKRTPGRSSRSPVPLGVPDASEPLDAPLVDAPGAPILTHRAAAEHPGRHTRLLLGGLIAVLAVAAALSIAVLGGRPREESAQVALAPSQDAPKETTEPADVANPAPEAHDAAEPAGPDVAPDGEPIAADQPMEVAYKPLEAEGAVGGDGEPVEVNRPVELATDVEPDQEAEAAETDLVLARLQVLEAIETFHEPRLELVEPPAGEPHDAEPVTPPDQQLAQAESAGSSDAPVASAPEPVAEADPEAVEGAIPEPAKEPVRVLTQAEDEANKAAIRSLKVFGVIADDNGVGVYTSEGELRQGDRFSGMAITEVTSRYVLFECGNKRYRWMLPRRHARADAGAS